MGYRIKIMNNLEILFELAEAKHELELLIDNTLSNLTPYETQRVLKEKINMKPINRLAKLTTGVFGGYLVGKHADAYEDSLEELKDQKTGANLARKNLARKTRDELDTKRKNLEDKARAELDAKRKNSLINKIRNMINTPDKLYPHTIKEGIAKQIGKVAVGGLVGTGIYKVGKSRGNYEGKIQGNYEGRIQGNKEGVAQGKRMGRLTGIPDGIDSGMKLRTQIDLDLKEYDKLSNKAKRGLNRILGKPSTPFDKQYTTSLRFPDEPDGSYERDFRVKKTIKR